MYKFILKKLPQLPNQENNQHNKKQKDRCYGKNYTTKAWIRKKQAPGIFGIYKDIYSVAY